MIDPKPLAAFFEYTLRPMTQDACELLDRMEKADIPPRALMKYAVDIMITQILIGCMTTITVTVFICSTLIYILSR